MISETDLDRAFADTLAESPAFRNWLLGQTKFALVASVSRLLVQEQIAAKPKKKPENWWRHWWCRLDDGSESETDIFATFAIADTELRFALHIEDKPPRGQFTPNQCPNYRRRAEFMARKPQYMDYTDFTTLLLAPQAFLDEHQDDAAHL